ncbi:CbiX/SirB N-terminal domain-containing protein [Neptuniibacter sp.]|uniref:sirohydrochlorin chelatase n=1 Tax=Neptuniibacter sp. TaxID=1962643 RepID=UPI002627F22C|nr:CbiX/SirB N-terminal domain-containing protein [Neptuniibacter sp.]MCP4596915.1 cobalamin biosynthesis protein CbiX [Neptuniibacter sp.]
MKALLLVAHGSRRAQSNDEVRELANKLKQRCGNHYDCVHAAFLELAAPLIPDGIQQCVEEGASEIVVLPFFLNSGRHVTEDIPKIVSTAKQDYPDVRIEIAAHLGASEMMIELLIAASNEASAS